MYTLQDGCANKSYGVNVARLAHLPDELLSRAKEILLTLESKGVTLSNNVLIKNDPVEEQWIKDLRNLDPLNMSPLEALNYLYDLKKKMKK